MLTKRERDAPCSNQAKRILKRFKLSGGLAAQTVKAPLWAYVKCISFHFTQDRNREMK